MAHQLTIRENGFVEYMSALKGGWHGLGKVLDYVPTSVQAISEAGFDWRTDMRPLQYRDNTGQFHTIQDQYAHIRVDNNEVLGLVSGRYRPLQNYEAFEFLDSLVQDEVMRYETAFSTFGGRKVVLLARMPDFSEVIEGDQLKKYIMFINSHDGKSKLTVKPVMTRVVCDNTMQAGLREHGVNYAFSHTGDMAEKIEAARDAIGLVELEFKKQQLKLQRFTQYRMDQEHVDMFLDSLFEMTPVMSERKKIDLITNKAFVKTNFKNGLGLNDGMQDSAWSMYNAVTQFTSHQMKAKTRNNTEEEASFNSLMFGVGSDIENKGFSMLNSMIDDNQLVTI